MLVKVQLKLLNGLHSAHSDVSSIGCVLSLSLANQANNLKPDGRQVQIGANGKIHLLSLNTCFEHVAGVWGL